MNTKLLTLAIIEVLISIGVTVAIVFISFKILKLLFFKTTELSKNNMAFTIFTSGIVLSIGLILSEILPSITNVIRLNTTQTEVIETSTIISYSGLYLAIGFILAVIINASAFLLFSILTTGINEFKEIQQNNVSVSILVVSILLSITLIVKESIALLISALIPYPELTNYL
ncbi:MAG: DUF350 domain-containing protein [Bacteroidia bacterium]|nr:DUF350 domain-containing protein [Bacteroidia bacterium]NNF32104.1 DUF350 domain-containing protein [Flavobacteriaceae bacterium]MBT8275143.1 DUF350 domain-containing protein [Bacteroidia bacterium]NNJ82246.1 DUF350 domain-containing protein [Flavobacteriaceae bacterium]NNK54968.1 DUF350 domain-containing protein [Flavobacteriaceae bacterium]